MSTWLPRQGSFVTLILFRVGPGIGELGADAATLHAIAAQVARTVRAEDVADVYAPATIGVLLSGVRDVAAATVIALQLRGLVDDNPLLGVDSCLVTGQGMALMLPGSDSVALVAQAEAALEESWLSPTDTLRARLVLARPDGGVSATPFTAELARVAGGQGRPRWVTLGTPPSSRA